MLYLLLNCRILLNVGSNPKACKATFTSLIVIKPHPSTSSNLKASNKSFFCLFESIILMSDLKLFNLFLTLNFKN